MFLSLLCTYRLGVEVPRVGLIGRGGLGCRLDVVVGASGGVGSSTPVVMPGQVTPGREVQGGGRVARQKPDPAPRRESPRQPSEDEEQFPAGSVATVEDLLFRIGT